METHSESSAQGSPEKLIIAAMIVGLSIIVIAMLSGVLGKGRSSVQVNEVKKDASQCSQALATQGKSSGEPHEDICGDICNEWKDKENSAQVIENSEASDIYEACISGKPSWIKEKE